MIGQKLIAWYEVNKRNLPWRDTGNPYLIWVSEVILQQTRVVQGLDYYRRLTDAYPNIFSMARADIDQLLKIWQGLGYYSRARNMHATARHIVEVHDGRFPTTYEALISLKGIGDYTASAIASIAFGQPVPAIDGNVNRVIARLRGIRQPVNKPSGQKEIRIHAQNLMVHHDPGTYNQAIMEFGALQCLPQNPDCNACILNLLCVAFRSELVDMLPVKEKTIKIVTRHFHYLHIRFGNCTFIRRRADGDIWNGLYEFPMIETDEDTNLENLRKTSAWKSHFDESIPLIKTLSDEITHRLTHRILKIRFYEIAVDRPLSAPEFIQIPAVDLHLYAVPIVIDNYLKRIYPTATISHHP